MNEKRQDKNTRHKTDEIGQKWLDEIPNKIYDQKMRLKLLDKKNA